MRRIRQLLALHFSAGASRRAIGRELGIAPSTVREYLARAAAAGIGWPLGADVTDESLMARLFVNAGVRAGARELPGIIATPRHRAGSRARGCCPRSLPRWRSAGSSVVVSPVDDGLPRRRAGADSAFAVHCVLPNGRPHKIGFRRRHVSHRAFATAGSSGHGELGSSVCLPRIRSRQKLLRNFALRFLSYEGLLSVLSAGAGRRR
jgi:hypothetical protein